MREVLLEPARLAGLRFEDDTIVDEIIEEVQRMGSAAGLPLMAFAMRSWWENRDKKTLRL